MSTKPAAGQNDILEDAAFEGNARGVNVPTALAGSFITLVDGELIYRAMENIVRNALKYAPDNSDIIVECIIANDELRIGISDCGPGVAQQDIEAIFRPFFRGPEAGASGGYGLGLAIAKHAIERHGGQIYATGAVQGGLMVTLAIPNRRDEGGR